MLAVSDSWAAVPFIAEARLAKSQRDALSEVAMKLADAISSSSREQSPELSAIAALLFIPGGTFRMGSDKHYRLQCSRDWRSAFSHFSTPYSFSKPASGRYRASPACFS